MQRLGLKVLNQPRKRHGNASQESNDIEPACPVLPKKNKPNRKEEIDQHEEKELVITDSPVVKPRYVLAGSQDSG